MQTDLQTELKQTRPFRSPVEEAFVSLQRTAAVLEHALETALKPSGITATQYNVLRILRGAGDAGLCRSEIGERMVRRVPDVTRLLDRLEETGLIARARGGDDRRYVTTRITPTGLAALESLDEVIAAFLQAHLGHVAPAQLRALTETLSALRQPALPLAAEAPTDPDCSSLVAAPRQTSEVDSQTSSPEQKAFQR